MEIVQFEQHSQKKFDRLFHEDDIIETELCGNGIGTNAISERAHIMFYNKKSGLFTK